MFKKMRKGFKRIFQKKLTEDNMKQTLEDLRNHLYKSNVSFEVAQEIINKINEVMEGELVGLFSKKQTLRSVVYDAVVDIVVRAAPDFGLLEEIIGKWEEENDPYIIMVLGVNGVGKTTTIAKLVHLFKENGLKTVVAAADTYRSGAIEQLKTHLDRLDTKIVKGQYGGDPSSIAWDAIEHARSPKAKRDDPKQVVIIDTAGRQVNDRNLLEQLRKIKRVSQPDITIMVGDSIAGNDLVEQASIFNKEVGIDGTILAKADMDLMGGAAVTIAAITEKPILFIGTGQAYEDLVEYNPAWFANMIVGEN